MDAVKSFNQELSSLYEIKPPISKAKMTSITKGAIKAIKFYKHVVQSVEKFIQKCRPEYKIPGLYVIDSIVRQSRHQFGPEKDVFAPRFAKNVRITFWHLYKCAEDEKSKVIRVLNLWQKNEVFTSDVIQPLFDLANSNSEMSKQVEEQIKRGSEKKGSAVSTSQQPGGGTSLSSTTPGSITVVTPESIMNNSSNQGQSIISSSNNTLHSSSSSSSMMMQNAVDQQVIQQLQTIQQLLKNHIPSNDQVKFNKKVLDDFDYSDEEDGGVGDNENNGQPPAAMIEALQGILGNERVLQQLKNMGAISNSQIQQLQQLLPSPSSHYSPNVQPSPIQHSLHQMPPPQSIPGWGQAKQSVITLELEEGEQAETDEDVQIVEDRSSYGRRSRSRDRSKRRRSRSRSPGTSKRRSSRRSRSRSRDRSRRRDRDRDEEREKRKEREKKGLPPIKKDHLSVCSTTLWVGHLSRLVAEDYLSDIFGEYGEIVSIDLIPPRGCAFVCMNRRMDAAKALKSLYKYKINGKPIILAWAPGKGMKDKQWKDYWDVELGVSYIPINKLDPQVNMAELEEGGMFDEDTMPEWMKTMRGVAPNTSNNPVPGSTSATVATTPQFIPVPEGIPPPVLEPPPGLNFGMSIPPPTATGLPPGLPPPPPNLLLPPRFPGPPPTQLPGGFDASQPPPALGLPFPPPLAGGGSGREDLVMDDRQRNGNKWNIKSDRDTSLTSRLRNLAGESAGGPPRSLLDMPDCPKPEGFENANGTPEDGEFGRLHQPPPPPPPPMDGPPPPSFVGNKRPPPFVGNEFQDSPGGRFGHRGGGRFGGGNVRGGGGRFHEFNHEWTPEETGFGHFDGGRGSGPLFRGRGITGRRGGRGGIFRDGPHEHWMEHDRPHFDQGFGDSNNIPPWGAGEQQVPWNDGPPHRGGRGNRGGGWGGTARGRFDFNRHSNDYERRDRFFNRRGHDASRSEDEENEESKEKQNEHIEPEQPRKNRKSRWGEKEDDDATETKDEAGLIEQKEEGSEQESAPMNEDNNESDQRNQDSHSNEPEDKNQGYFNKSEDMCLDAQPIELEDSSQNPNHPNEPEDNIQNPQPNEPEDRSHDPHLNQPKDRILDCQPRDDLSNLDQEHIQVESNNFNNQDFQQCDPSPPPPSENEEKREETYNPSDLPSEQPQSLHENDKFESESKVTECPQSDDIKPAETMVTTNFEDGGS